MDSTLVVNEDQAIDGVGVAQPTCAVIHEEYEWELEHQHLAKDDSLLSKPPSLDLLFMNKVHSKSWSSTSVLPSVVTTTTTFQIFP